MFRIEGPSTLKDIMANSYSLVTPYLIPKNMKKVQNLGDGFILNGIERRLGRFDDTRVISTRAKPDAAALARVREARKVIVGGANGLSDNFAPWKGFEPALFDDKGLKFYLFGMGLNGEPKRNLGFTAKARAIIEEIHVRVPYSSWRCPRTVALLEESFPHLAGQFLMTGCPALYDEPVLRNSVFERARDSVAVTITERDDFFEREYLTLLDVRKHFPRARRYLVLHQDFRSKAGPLARRFRREPEGPAAQIAVLHQLAEDMGFEIVAPASQTACRAFYTDIDLHVGSRLHAHLHFLSQNKKTYLTYVDNRCVGFSEHYGFPLIEPGELGAHLDFDFEPTREAIRSSFVTMQTFVDSIHAS